MRNSNISIDAGAYSDVSFPIQLKSTNYTVSITGGSNALETIDIGYNWQTKRTSGFAIKENSERSALLEIIVIGNV